MDSGKTDDEHQKGTIAHERFIEGSRDKQRKHVENNPLGHVASPGDVGPAAPDAFWSQTVPHFQLPELSMPIAFGDGNAISPISNGSEEIEGHQHVMPTAVLSDRDSCNGLIFETAYASDGDIDPSCISGVFDSFVQPDHVLQGPTVEQVHQSDNFMDE